MGFKFVRDRNGVHSPLVPLTVGATAVKEGDAVIVGASQNLIIPSTANSDYIVGVASHDAAVGATCNVYPATDTAEFEVITVTTGYAEATYKFKTCDLATFTSGAMAINPAADTGHQVLMLELVEGETSASAGNKVRVKFNLRAGVGA